MSTPRGIAILGSTGSIGRSTLAVIGLHPDRFRVAALGAYGSWEVVVEQARQFQPDVVVLVDPQAAAQARAALGQCGSKVRVESGEEALAAVVKSRPDLILIDIQLPVMDGYEATRRIKADPSLSSIPIIAVTSYALNGDEEKARAAGCNDFVPKPYSPRQLLAKIREFLR